MTLKYARSGAVVALMLALVLSAGAADNRTKLKPGFNLFSAQQDIELGREASQQTEKELKILNDRQATAYIDALGRKLASYAPGEKYPYQFKIVNDTAINAFALPGGYVYLNRGAIEAADNEAQIAGVMAHEIGHVVLRHGTNQMSKAYVAQAPLAVLGGFLGNNSITNMLAQVGATSLLLHYSREAETQADLMGTQILHDSGYDPRAMVEFFEKIEAESQGRAIQFFSDHPNPENRIGNVQREIQKLGGAPANPRRDTPDFQTAKSRIASTAAPGKSGNSSTARSGDNRPPAPPSGRMVAYNGQDIQFRHPDNWRASGQGSAVTIAPDGGVVNGSLAYGMLMSAYEPDDSRNERLALSEATDALLKNLQRSNPGMRITRSPERTQLGKNQAYSAEASNTSPAGGTEKDWIVTTLSPDGNLYYFVGVAPQNEFNSYSRTFQRVLDTVRFK